MGRPLRVARVSRPSLSPEKVGPTFPGRFVALAVCAVRSGGWRDPAAVEVPCSWPSLRTVHFGVGLAFSRFRWSNGGEFVPFESCLREMGTILYANSLPRLHVNETREDET